MERKFNRNLSNNGSGSIGLQKQVIENRRNHKENVPDLTDFMNDMFFGTTSTGKKVYNLTGAEGLNDDSDSFDSSRRSVNSFDSSRRSVNSFDSSRRSVSSRSTQEWLEEAKRMVAQSPGRCESPPKLVGSPRFATAHSITASDKRDPQSRSARRHRTLEGVSGEILSKSAKHTRNKSQASFEPPPAEESPASAVQKWFSNIRKPQSGPTINPSPTVPSDPTTSRSIGYVEVPPLPPRQSVARKSRFQKNTDVSQPHLIPHPNNPPLLKRTFKIPATLNTTATNAATVLDTQMLSPPKHLVESARRRSISSSTCSMPETPILSPPRNLVETAPRRSVSTFPSDRPLPRDNLIEQFQAQESRDQALNRFLKEQRAKMEKIMSGEINGKAKIVLSGSTNTTSMVAAICYAWLLENRMRADEGRVREGSNGEMVVPVMNMKREKMWKQRQAAWLFHHVGIDASAFLFSEEVDLEKLMMTNKLNILVVGQDILRTNGEVGSCCTIITDNYCEDAYDLLQTPMLKKLLLAGILLDTQNLNPSAKFSTTRDSEAIQLLLVGSAPTYRNSLFDQLMLDQRDDAFSGVLQKYYGKPPTESNSSKGSTPEHQASAKNSDQEGVAPIANKSPKDAKKAKANIVSPNPGKPAPAHTKSPAATSAKSSESSRGKNTFFLAKWFGFGSR